MARARHAFEVSHGRIRLRVRVLETVREVDSEYPGGRRRLEGKLVHAYFDPAKVGAKHTGTIVLAKDADLIDHVPHEVAHASKHHLGGVITDHNEERHATAIGVLTSNIVSQLRKLGLEV